MSVCCFFCFFPKAEQHGSYALQPTCVGLFCALVAFVWGFFFNVCVRARVC